MSSSTILSDNGVTSGSAGIKSTGGSDGTLLLQTTTASGTATTAVLIDNAQNLGLGVTPSGSASSSMFFKNNFDFYVKDSGGTFRRFMEYDNSNNLYFGMVDGPVSGGGLYFRSGTGTTTNMLLDSSGSLLVGTTSSLTSGRSAFWSSTAVPAAEFRVNAASSDATQAISIVKNSTTNTTAQVIANFTINSGGTGAGQINCNGASQAAFGSFSDSRLKENIVDLPSQLSNIMALRPVEFDYIESEGGGHQIGFIAQEMQTVYPDAIGERQPDNMLSITGWSKTEARLVKAIQELKAELDTAKEQIAALQGAAK